MSWSDQDIDKLFRQSAQPEVPPFQESFWTEMEGMLPEQKRKKVAVWWWAGGAATLVAVITVGIFIAASGANGTRQSAGVSAKMKSENVEQSYGTTNHELKAASVEKTEVKLQKSDVISPAQSLTDGIQTQEAVQAGKTNDTPRVTERFVANNAVSLSVIDKPMNELPKLGLVFTPLTFHPEMPEKPEYKPTRFYVQAGAGIGLSARKNVPQTSDVLHCYTLGGGLYKKIDNVVLTLGLQGRVDFVRNIRYTYFPDGTNAKRIDAEYHQLYSLEMPASIGIVNGRNTFAVNVNAGFQAGVFGELKETNNNVLVRSENTFVRVDKKATTLTMELGLSYLRTISPDWYLGAGLNTDIIGPFNGSSYAGKERLLPVNAQVMLRRTF